MSDNGGTLFGFIRDIKQRRQDGQVRDQLKNYLTSPDSTITAINDIDPATAIALRSQRDQTVAIDQKAQAGNFAQVTSYLRGLPQGSDVGKAIDDITPYLTGNLGMTPANVAAARGAIVAQPSIVGSLDDEARKAALAYHILGPGSALMQGNAVVRNQPFASRVLTVPDGQGGNNVVTVDPNAAGGGGVDPNAAGGGGGAPAGGAGSPISVRTNNPGALRPDNRSKWRGATGTEGGFLTFDSPENGRRAQVINLMNQQRLHGINTLSALTSKYAPTGDNNDPAAYAARIGRTLGVDPTAPINLADSTVAGRVADAMAMVESGGSPGTYTSRGAAPGGQAGGAGPGATVVMRNPGAGPTVRTLSPQEVQDNGLPAGTSAQIDSKTGKITVLGRPPAAAGGGRGGNVAPDVLARRASDAADGFSRLETSARGLLANPNLGSAVGVVSGRLPSLVLGQGVQDFRNQSDALQSNVGMQALQMFKQMSATGASGFGNLSNEEGRRLERMLGTLDSTSSPDLYKKTLGDVVTFAQQKRRDMLAGARSAGGGAPDGGGGAPAVGTVARNPNNGARVQWDGSRWVPVK